MLRCVSVSFLSNLAMSDKIVIETAPYDPRFSSTVDQSKVGLHSTHISRRFSIPHALEHISAIVSR